MDDVKRKLMQSPMDPVDNTKNDNENLPREEKEKTILTKCTSSSKTQLVTDSLYSISFLWEIFSI